MAEVFKRGDAEVREQIVACTADDKWFDAADADGDGVITREEWRGWHYGRSGKHFAKCEASASAQSEAEDAVAPPTTLQLRRLFIRASVPFIGFGFVDNFIMLIAGDQIDATFGAALGLSSMAAAGLGNMVSDVIGIQSGDMIERASDKMGMPDAELTPAQAKTSSARRVSTLASMIGISIGCILGLCPLLWMEDEESKALRECFEGIDKDNSGTISVCELESALHTFGSQFSRNDVEVIFAEIDSDRSASINFEEFKILAGRWKAMADAHKEK